MPEGVRPKGSPRKLDYLCTVEWASGPRDGRIDSYYLNPRGKYWLLWNRFQDENSWEWAWTWVLYGYATKQGADPKTAGTYILLDAWTEEKEQWGLAPFFLIDQPGLLSVADISEIGRKVW